jgi:carbon monoxide dehydrogenase subunit G
VEIDFERGTRIVAPVEVVWAEMDSLEDLLSKSPQLMSFSLLTGDRAAVRTRLTWGPLKYEVAGTMTVRQAVANQQLDYSVVVPDLGLDYSATLRLAPTGAGETSLQYAAHLEMNHRLASKLRGLFLEVVEEHIHGLVGRVKTRAEQRRLADERLLK